MQEIQSIPAPSPDGQMIRCLFDQAEIRTEEVVNCEVSGCPNFIFISEDANRHDETSELVATCAKRVIQRVIELGSIAS